MMSWLWCPTWARYMFYLSLPFNFLLLFSNSQLLSLCFIYFFIFSSKDFSGSSVLLFVSLMLCMFIAHLLYIPFTCSLSILCLIHLLSFKSSQLYCQFAWFWLVKCCVKIWGLKQLPPSEYTIYAPLFLYVCALKLRYKFLTNSSWEYGVKIKLACLHPKLASPSKAAQVKAIQSYAGNNVLYSMQPTNYDHYWYLRV